MAESNFQSKVSNWLRSKGCYVLITTVVPGIPTGCPDIIALLPGGGWVALECKKNGKSKFRPLQRETIKLLSEMYYARAVYPENWEEIKKELMEII